MPHIAVDMREGISDTEIGSECSSSIKKSKNQERRKEKRRKKCGCKTSSQKHVEGVQDW